MKPNSKNRRLLWLAGTSVGVASIVGLLSALLASAGPATPGAPTSAVIQELQSKVSLLAGGNMGASATPPSTAEVVATTRGQALTLTEGAADNLDSTAPVYVVQLTGKFTGYDAKVPSDAPLPVGGALTFIFDPASGQVTDWGIPPQPLDLSALGQVSTFPVSIAPVGG